MAGTGNLKDVTPAMFTRLAATLDGAMTSSADGVGRLYQGPRHAVLRRSLASAAKRLLVLPCPRAAAGERSAMVFEKEAFTTIPGSAENEPLCDEQR